jgi:hypothetical protein
MKSKYCEWLCVAGQSYPNADVGDRCHNNCGFNPPQLLSVTYWATSGLYYAIDNLIYVSREVTYPSLIRYYKLPKIIL